MLSFALMQQSAFAANHKRLGNVFTESKERIDEPRSLSQPNRPNLLVITTDQQRWDTLSIVQKQLKHYRNKFQIQTPNLDRLAKSGTLFWNAYCQSPSCGPARSSLRTGCSTARTGVQGNREMVGMDERDDSMTRLKNLWTYDQILVEKLGYVSETYGKKHLPNTLLHKHEPLADESVLQYDDYDMEMRQPNLTLQEFQARYPFHLDYFADNDNLRKRPIRSERINGLSTFPYRPTKMDASNWKSKKDSQKDSSDPGSKSFGVDSLGSNYTSTALIGQMGLLALDRLGQEYKDTSQPFCLTVSFNSPHPPFIVTRDYLKQYWSQRRHLYFPHPDENMQSSSPYYNKDKSETRRFETKSLNAEWTAIYYALITEVDTWVGQLLDKLDELALTTETLIIFTSDHGEMLGAHGLAGKNNFYEEAARVPLILSYPKVIASDQTIQTMANHIDLVSTILDYMDGKEHDTSDGNSLRRLMEHRSYNENYDENVAISEEITPNNKRPSYMIRKDDFKLMIANNPTAPTMDMFVFLKEDPFETNNLLGGQDSQALTSRQIGKVEHLKALLLDWMKRVDGEQFFFSKPAGGGPNEIQGVTARRTWPKADFWVSDDVLFFGKSVLARGQYISNEYLYIGRTNPGILRLIDISVQGRDSIFFKLSVNSAVIESDNYLRLQVSFTSSERLASIDARVVIRHSAGPEMLVDIKQL
ncbi:hypothetical protein MPSEU_001005100 [Mayamaea pseudoterrestris]|nr:hypothetical protein MPSEU_001005100 [Mayamaea pseudoterrestris]